MARDSDPSAPTPMMAQYLGLKAEVPGCLLFYRMGDFFELFFEDAGIAAAALDIALTARGDHDGAPVPMCGVPVHSAEAYLARLIRAGHRVAIAEQVETPAAARARGGKALVARAIVRIVTAGTLTEEALLEPLRANMLVALAEAGGEIGIAAADISTGAFETLSCRPADLEAELARIDPAEIVAPAALTPRPHMASPDGFDSVEGERSLKQRFGLATLDGLGDFTRAERAACGGLLAYLRRAGGDAMLRPPRRVLRADHMSIDEPTRQSLELVRAASGERAGSLLGCIDRTVTGAGARRLAADLSAPLLGRAAIEARLDLVAWFAGDPAKREGVRAALRALPDAGRALGRIAAGRGSPRDLAQLRDALNGARVLHDMLAGAGDVPSLLADALPRLRGHGAFTDRLGRALVAAPAIDADKGGFIAEGYDAALDALRARGGDGRRAIAALEARFRERSGIAGLKIRHNAVLGYHIEVAARHADGLMAPDSGFIHRQTLAGVVRFNAPELHEAALEVNAAGAHALAAEAAHLEELNASALKRSGEIAATCDALARLDVGAALAALADEDGWCRPTLVDAPLFEIEGGRHPAVAAALRKAGGGAGFIPNDCRLTDRARLWLITGPNMGGKSTFLRQNALIAVLAQIGSFVPALSARVGIVDRLFSRVGASDNLATGRSTFMVEMVETAAILSQATEHSLVILDEVGRGTSTYDGLAIAWAVLEAVHDVNRCRCLFATHYHELTRLGARLDALSLHHVRAREHRGDLVLLHDLAPGAADRSYGLAVARLAGLPPAVVERARAILARLESARAATGGLAAGLDDLPLFAAAEVRAPDPLAAALDAIDADRLSPRDALDTIYALKRLAAGED